MNFASNLGAMILFIWNGAVIWSIGLPMMAANIAGNWLGSRLAIKVGTEAVRRFLWVSLSLLLATLVWRFFISPHLPMPDAGPAAMRRRLWGWRPEADAGPVRAGSGGGCGAGPSRERAPSLAPIPAAC